MTIVNPESEGKTRQYTDEDLERIQKEAKQIYYQEEEGEEEEEDDDEVSEGELNPKMEKAITIAGIVAAAIIVGIVVYLIGSFFGFFKFGGTKDKKDEKAKTEQESGKIEMIDLTGMTYDEAESALKKLGLGIRDGGKQSSDKFAEGEIISQDIEEGEMVKKNSTVKVIVSSGAGEIEVPDVKGLDETSAINKIQDQGFKYSRDYQNSDTVANGNVISQSPEAGSSAKKGDTISIVVSQGKAAVPVPDVKGKSENDAKNELSAAGLTVTNVTNENSDSVPAGHVISQSIAPGKYVDEGTDITLVVSSGPKTTYYKFSATISAPEDNEEVESADIILTDTNGDMIEQWNNIAISSFPYRLEKTDILEISSGVLEITWKLSDGSIQEQRERVTFKKQ